MRLGRGDGWVPYRCETLLRSPLALKWKLSTYFVIQTTLKHSGQNTEFPLTEVYDILTVPESKTKFVDDSNFIKYVGRFPSTQYPLGRVRGTLDISSDSRHIRHQVETEIWWLWRTQRIQLREIHSGKRHVTPTSVPPVTWPSTVGENSSLPE